MSFKSFSSTHTVLTKDQLDKKNKDKSDKDQTTEKAAKGSTDSATPTKS